MPSETISAGVVLALPLSPAPPVGQTPGGDSNSKRKGSPRGKGYDTVRTRGGGCCGMEEILIGLEPRAAHVELAAVVYKLVLFSLSYIFCFGRRCPQTTSADWRLSQICHLSISCSVVLVIFRLGSLWRAFLLAEPSVQGYEELHYTALYYSSKHCTLTFCPPPCCRQNPSFTMHPADVGRSQRPDSMSLPVSEYGAHDRLANGQTPFKE